MGNFDSGYAKLNKEQKVAVDTIDGPVMVIAGPGTGKTQVLALRIANILKKTDTPADGILCLTFTNSGVRAMRERLHSLIGPDAARVQITTFHSFAGSILEEFYEALGLSAAPKLLDEKDAVLLCDELLENHPWEYLRPRSGGAHNFKDLKSLISLAKREGMSPSDVESEIETEIQKLTTDPESKSSRGTSKGELKKDVTEKIERLMRTKEAAKFYALYETTKTERGLADYDDMLSLLVQLVETSADARDSIRERHLYVLVDEHQDSSHIQNTFLEKVWGATEKPNLFVVGDDRQLIYGFGGASLTHFEGFKDVFTGAKVISLTENYRSTQIILDTANAILESAVAKGKLLGQSKESYPISLIEAEYPRDEILAAGIAIQKKLKEGVPPNECVLIVPKNAHVRSAVPVLMDLGIPVAAGANVHFFEASEARSFMTILRAITDPFAYDTIAALLLDPISGVPTLTAHRFLKDTHKSTIASLAEGDEAIQILGKTLTSLIEDQNDIYALIQQIGQTFFFAREMEQQTFLRNIEIVRTMLHLTLARLEKEPKMTLQTFLTFLERLESYGEDIPLAIFSADEGVQVMTMHASKGLEYDFVWIAHLDEASLMRGKKMGFTLPEKLAEKALKKDELTARRELYVALTRAKRFATLSYARTSYTGADQHVATIIAELPEDTLIKKSAEITEKEIIAHDPKVYVTSKPLPKATSVIQEIQRMVEKEYRHSRIAVTHLNNFYTCPWMWYFRNFLRVPEAKSESLEFGTLMHNCLNRIFKDRTLAEHIPKLIDEEIEKLKMTDPNTAKRFKTVAEKALSQYIDGECKDVGEHTRTEINLSYKDPEFPHFEITGKIDLVESLDDETLQVTDFKTGKAHGKRDIEKRDEEERLSDKLRQLVMYSYLIMHQKEEKVISHSRLLFLESEKDRVYETKITNDEIALLRKDIRDFDESLVSGGWIDRKCYNTRYGQECEYCRLKDRIK